MSAKLNLDDIVQWFDAVSNHSDNKKIFDAFSQNQLKSKAWLIDQLNKCLEHLRPHNIVIHGGWIGTLSSLLFQQFDAEIEHITSIDIDPSVEDIAYRVNSKKANSNNFTHITMNMLDYVYESVPDIVINTSCEHITAQDLRIWFDNIPEASIIVCQSNNYTQLDEHINCPKNLTDFQTQLPLTKILFQGVYPCKQYSRFMIIGKKD